MFTRTLHSLRTRLLLASLLIEAIMLAILVGNSVRLIQEHLSKQAEIRIQAIELAYKTALAAPLAARDYPTLRDILAGWMGAEDMHYLVVTDRSGRILESVNWDVEKLLPEPAPVRLAADTIHISFTVDFQGLTYGRVHYGLSAAFLHQARTVLFEQSVTIALIELTLTFVLLFATGYWMTREFTALIHASERIASGDFSVRLALMGDDEVSGVAHSFNAMADALDRQIRELRDEEERFRAIADYTYSWENWFGPDGELRWINSAVERMTGYAVRDCLTMNQFPLPMVYIQDRELLLRQHGQALAGKTGQDLEFRINTRDGKLLWVAMAWQPIYSDDGRSLGYRSSIRDISLQHFANEELAYAAAHDALTGLHNRRAFEQHLIEQLNASDHRGLFVFYIDLDQFKLVNDTCGHTAGDALLQHLARLMVMRFSFGFLARLGGDEFGMVLSDIELDEAERRAQIIIDDIRKLPFIWEGRSFRIGASIGIVQSSPSLNRMSDLLVAADTACYAAKERGRNRVQVYLPDDLYFRQRQTDYLSLTQISEALGKGLLMLYAQRIRALRPGLTDYFELLVRMRDEQGQVIPPGRFVPAAERYGMMPLIDRWVIDAACQRIRALLDRGAHPPRLNINLSGLTLADPGLADFIRHAVKKYAIDPQLIGFEITESCAIAQLDHALAFIEFCGEMGFELALDDFGSGLSSFGYLKRFKVQVLKIDGIFVQHADRDGDDRAVIDSLVRLASLRGLKTVAEYVTTAEVLRVVTGLGVDYAQGYEVHEPEPLEKALNIELAQ